MYDEAIEDVSVTIATIETLLREKCVNRLTALYILDTVIAQLFAKIDPSRFELLLDESMERIHSQHNQLRGELPSPGRRVIALRSFSSGMPQHC